MANRICLPNVSVGPKVGQDQLVSDQRLCLPAMNVQPQIGDSGVIIIFGSSGAVVFGSSGKIKF